MTEWTVCSCQQTESDEGNSAIEPNGFQSNKASPECGEALVQAVSIVSVLTEGRVVRPRMKLAALLA